MRPAHALVVCAALALGACSASPLAPSPSALVGTDGASAGVASRPLPTDTARISTRGALHAEMAAVRAATAGYHDVSKAIADGYLAPSAEACVESPAGAMGVHSVNPALAGNTAVDPLRPEALLYLPTRGGGFRLVGVEYFVPLLLRSPAGAVAPWFSPAPWPSDYTVVNAAPTLFGERFHGFMAGHEPGMPWHYDLHFWAWAPNPDGDLADFNPRLSCSDEE